MDLGWRLYLSDEMSAVLDRVGGAWDRTVAGIDSGGAKAVRVFADVEERVVTMGRSFVSWASNGARTFGGVVAALAGQSGLLGSLLGGPVGLASMMHRVVAGSMEAGGEIENLQLAFATLMHSTDGARAHLAELQQFAVGKPFEFSYLATASRTLQSFGYTARDTMGMLRDFGDVAAGSGVGTRGFDTMVRISGQIRTMGRMTRGHISQLGAVGLDVNRILRDQLHLSESQIANIAHAGVDRERLIQGLREGMRLQWGGGMERASATLTAKLSDLSDTFGNLKRMIYESLGPVLIPLVDAFASFLTLNSKRIASAFVLLFTVVVNVIRAVVGPVFGAVSDLMGRARDDAGSTLSDIGRRFQRFALIIEGVAALISGDDGRGFSRISQSLKDRLEAAGLWPFVVRLGRLASLVRAMLRGMFAGIAEVAGDRIASISSFLSRVAGGADGLRAARAQAERLGHAIIRIVLAFFAFREALAVVRFVVQHFEHLRMAVMVLRVAFTFLAAHPIVLALIAVGVALFLLYRHFRGNVQVMGALRAAWDRLKAALAPVGALFVRLWEAFKAFAETAGTALVGALRQIGAALSPLLYPLRVIGSFIAVGLYLHALLSVAALSMLGRVALWVFTTMLRPIVETARAAGQLATWALPLLIAGVDYMRVSFARFYPYLNQAIRGVRILASIVGIVLYVAFLIAARAVTSVVQSLFKTFRIAFFGIAFLLRTTFGFLIPFVTPIFSALASLVSTLFGGIAGTILAPIRFIAGQLVTVFRGLPRALQPEALRGAVDTLDQFSRGPRPGAPGAPAGDANAAARGQINTSRAAPARAANAVSSATATIAAQGSPSVTVLPAPPAPVVVQIDGRTVATAVRRQQDGDRLRGGGTVPANR